MESFRNYSRGAEIKSIKGLRVTSVTKNPRIVTQDRRSVRRIRTMQGIQVRTLRFVAGLQGENYKD